MTVGSSFLKLGSGKMAVVHNMVCGNIGETLNELISRNLARDYQHLKDAWAVLTLDPAFCE